MDPNLFHLDWERTFEALVGIIVLSFLVERACALLFESRWWISRFEDDRVGNAPGAEDSGDQSKIKPGDTPPASSQKLLPGRGYPLKEALGFILALVICWKWHFDAVSIILLQKEKHLAGIFVTAAIVAGGSKASIALFQDLLKIRSNAENERRDLKASDKQG